MPTTKLLMTFPVTETSHTLDEYRARGGYATLDTLKAFYSDSLDAIEEKGREPLVATAIRGQLARMDGQRQGLKAQQAVNEQALAHLKGCTFRYLKKPAAEAGELYGIPVLKGGVWSFG